MMLLSIQSISYFNVKRTLCTVKVFGSPFWLVAFIR